MSGYLDFNPEVKKQQICIQIPEMKSATIKYELFLGYSTKVF